MPQQIHAPQMAQYTTWRNPTPHKQVVDLAEGEGINRRVTRYEILPGQSAQIDSKYDRAIHMVDCGLPECHQSRELGYGHFCKKGHPGTIMGGLAPMLVREGVADQKLPDCLDVDRQAKKDAEIARLKAAEHLRQAEDNAVLANAVSAKAIAMAAHEAEELEKATRPEPKADVKPSAPQRR